MSRMGDQEVDTLQEMPLYQDKERAFARLVESKAALLVAIAVAAGLFWSLLFFQFTVDDAYISFRYAKMLVEHHVWNWNPSGARVESYTSATYTVLAILPALLHLPTALFFKLTGLLCIGWMLYRLRTEAGSRFAWVLGALFAGLSPFVWVHAFAGLETPLYMALILELALCARRASERAPAFVCLVALLLPLTRPEGTVFAAAGLLLYWRQREDKGRVGLWAGIAALAGVIYFAWRWHYFGHPLPNPFYVKVSHASLTKLAANVNKTKDYLLTLVLVLFFARTRTTRVFACCSLALMLVLFEPHELIMNYSDRFFFQMVFPVLLLFLIAEQVDRMARVAAFGGAVFLASVSFGWVSDALTYFPYLRAAHMDLGRRLAPFAADHTLLIGDAGAVPYYSGWVSYDFLGLCTNEIAQHGMSRAFLERTHPDLIVLYGQVPGPGPEVTVPVSSEQMVRQYVGDSHQYAYAGASHWREFYLIEFLRKDTKDHDAIQAALDANTAASAAFKPSLKGLILQQYVPWSK